MPLTANKGRIAIEEAPFLHSSEEGEKKAQGSTESPSFLYLVFIFARVWPDQRESSAGTEDRELIRLVSGRSCAPSDRRFIIFLPELFHFTLVGAQSAVSQWCKGPHLSWVLISHSRSM